MKVNKPEKPKKQVSKPVNYRKLFTVKKRLGETLKIACPNINDKSGIYFYIRETKDKKYIYLGKATSLLDRNIDHLQGYKQRIDVSIKKRGFYSKDNPTGWKLNVLNFPKDQLDEKEQYYIELYQKAGYELYNIESGGTTGKTDINQRKIGKGYYDGIARGKEKTKEQVKTYFTKYLDYSIKGKPTKIKERKFAEFTDFLAENNESDTD